MPKDCEDTMLMRIIGGAGTIAKVLCETTDAETATTACTEGMERVELDISVLVQALDGIEAEIENMAALLDIDLINSKVFDLIGKNLVEKLGATAVS